MDVRRCITLHNEILLDGWIHSGHDAHTFESQCKTWYDSAPADAERIREDLTPDLFEFLRHARQPIEQFFAFFYYVSDLVHPLSLFMDYKVWQYDVEEGEEKRYVTLYHANQLGSHPLGLIFDRETNLAIFLPTIWALDDHFNEKAFWRPLDSILQSWLLAIRKGRIVAKSKDFYAAQTQYPKHQDPWMLVPYSQIILEETIDTFNSLVQAIEERLPNLPTLAAEQSTTGLVDEEALDTMQLAAGFLRSFLLRARRPHFDFIAPGLSILNSRSVASQPFWSYLSDPTSDGTLPPFLLFPSTHPYTPPRHPTNPPLSGLAAYTTPLSAGLKTAWHIYSHARSLTSAIRDGFKYYARVTELGRQDLDSPFLYPFNKTREYQGGLYLSPAYKSAEDEVILLLPQLVQRDGCARASDSTEARVDRDLYRVGFTAFKGSAMPCLGDVLRHWLGMVEAGHWKIGEQGVMGGIEAWAEADKIETYEAYVLPMPDC